jgi:acyl-coenzyme A synthetase/AMP-(fatty) acid ligase
MGYYNNPEKTDLVFTQNPLNTKYPELIYRTGDVVVLNNLGEIIFKGRRDSLIKHLGYRIELGEIEHIIINNLKLVPNGCAIYNQQVKEIYFVYESQSEISSAEFRKSIGQALPKYMIPTKYIQLEKLPMNTNGKIDRLSLSKSING